MSASTVGPIVPRSEPGQHGQTGQPGQATVELVLALPAVVAVLLLVVQVGLVGRDQLLVVHAAREAARAASVEPDPEAAASAATRAAGAAAGLDPRRLSVATRLDGDLVRVTVRYRAPTDVPLVGALVGEPTLEASVAMRVEGTSESSDPPGVPRPAWRSRRAAACLFSGSFQLPHFGDCTHEGHPRRHGQRSSTSSVAWSWRSANSKPSSAMPAPPGWPS